MWSELVLSKYSGRNTDALGEHSGALLRFRDGSVTTREIARALILPRTLPSGIARLAAERASISATSISSGLASSLMAAQAGPSLIGKLSAGAAATDDGYDKFAVHLIDARYHER